MKVLVTGGGGFLGSRIVAMLHERGDEVTALGRRRYPQLEEAGMATLQADLRDGPAIMRACEGMDVVFHAGAITGIWGRRRDFDEINTGGTQNVIAACRAAGVSRLVFTSSPSVVCGEDDLCGVDESVPYPERYQADYPRAKAAAERLVLAANDANLATVALRPHLIFGPGDPNLIPRVIHRARTGRLIQVGDGTNLVDVTYVDNAASAHVLACDALAAGTAGSLATGDLSGASACAGKAYFISQGEPVSIWPWFNDLLERVGAPPVTRRISYRTAYRIGTLMEAAYRLVGSTKEPTMTRFLAIQLAKSHYFDISAARRDFGYRVEISTDEAVARTVASMKQGRSHP